MKILKAGCELHSLILIEWNFPVLNGMTDLALLKETKLFVYPESSWKKED